MQSDEKEGERGIEIWDGNLILEYSMKRSFDKNIKDKNNCTIVRV